MTTNSYRSAAMRSPFSGLVLALLWIFQVLFLSTAATTLALLVGTLKSSPFYLLGENKEIIVLPGLTPIPYIIMLCIAAILTLLTCIEIFMYFQGDLTPILFLYFTIFKTLSWVVVVGLDVWSISRPWLWSLKGDISKGVTFYRIYLWVMLGGSVGVFLLFLLGLVYSSAVMRRHRRHTKAWAGQFANQS